MINNPGNWAGNYSYRAARIHRPETTEELQQIVTRGTRLKALGSRHSFNDIADSPEDLISLERFDRVIGLDWDRRSVTVEAGVRYGDLARWLHGEGYALHNLASLPHISVAGACATATHGSGDRNGNLATAVTALEMVTADGALIQLSRAGNPGEFEGAVVGLGGLGVVTQLTLDVSPTFQMQQDVYENLPITALEQHYDELTADIYSVSLFTDWRSSQINQVWLKRLLPDGKLIRAEPELFGATLAAGHLHPIAALSAENCTEQMGLGGPWFERLPHFRMDFTPSSGAELQSEYLIPRPHAIAALHAIDRMREQIAPLLQISEVRTIAADDLWMSPCYRQACAGIHFTWKPDWEHVSKLLPVIEKALEPFQARPHWAKLFTTPPARLATLFERLPDFQRLMQRYDPAGKFHNAYLDRHILGRAVD